MDCEGKYDSWDAGTGGVTSMFMMCSSRVAIISRWSIRGAVSSSGACAMSAPENDMRFSDQPGATTTLSRSGQKAPHVHDAKCTTITRDLRSRRELETRKRKSVQPSPCAGRRLNWPREGLHLDAPCDHVVQMVRCSGRCHQAQVLLCPQPIKKITMSPSSKCCNSLFPNNEHCTKGMIKSIKGEKQFAAWLTKKKKEAFLVPATLAPLPTPSSRPKRVGSPSWQHAHHTYQIHPESKDGVNG